MQPGFRFFDGHTFFFAAQDGGGAGMNMKNRFWLLLLFWLAASGVLAASCDDSKPDACGPDRPQYPEIGCLSPEDADNDREYDWYLTQMGTGPAEGSNCGPTSVAMSMRWYDARLDEPVADIRETITPGQTGWWYTNDIADALDAWGVPYRIQPAAREALLEALDAGHILLLCLNMGYITRAPDPAATHFDRFYAYDSGHFLVVKGHFDSARWLIVHDPNNWGNDYYDEAKTNPFGKNRYYNTEEVLQSMNVWWPYFFEIGISDGKRHRHIPVGRSGP